MKRVNYFLKNLCEFNEGLSRSGIFRSMKRVLDNHVTALSTLLTLL